MEDQTIRNDTAQIPCHAETRKLVRGLKRGGETYDDLFRRMVDQYDPDAANDPKGVDDES